MRAVGVHTSKSSWYQFPRFLSSMLSYPTVNFKKHLYPKVGSDNYEKHGKEAPPAAPILKNIRIVNKKKSHG